jgi:hypothetical protein
LTSFNDQMSTLIEDALTSKLAAWLNDNRPAEIPVSVPIQVANRDELRSRPCIVLATSETKPIPAMRHTARLKLDIHLFTQVDDTPITDHANWAVALVNVLAGIQTLKAALDSESFCLHDLLLRDSSTVPDETRGRETVISYEPVVSAV